MPYFNQEKADKMAGKTIIAALTVYDLETCVVDEIQVKGAITSVSEADGVVVLLAGEQDELVLSPDLDNFIEAPPAEYRFQSTGEVVVNPDYMITCMVQSNGPASVDILRRRQPAV